MSFIGNLLKIIAIGAFFVATGPFGLTVGSTLATALRIGGAVLGYLGALQDRPRLANERQRLSIQTTLEPGTPIPVVYGRAKVGAIVADWFLNNDLPDVSRSLLLYVCVFCHGSRDGNGVAAIDEVWLDNRKAVDDTGARIWPYKRFAVEHTPFLGSTTQNVGATSFSSFGAITAIPGNVAGSGWNLTTDTGKGICCIGFMLNNVDTRTFDQSPIAITSSSVANPTVITTGAAHGFTSGDSVRIASHSGSTPSLNAEWVCTVTGTTTLTIPANVTVGGTGGTVKRFAEGPLFRGPPTVAAVIRGNRVYDTRTSTWTAGGANPAMCIRDFLLASVYGCGFTAAYLHEQSFKDAADYCDTLVSHAVGSTITITSSDAGTDRVLTAAAHGFATGDRIRIAGHSGATPALNGDHAAITVVDSTHFTIDGVNITVGGTGGTVIKLVQQKRHTCNGVVDTSRPTGDTLQELLSSCRGNLVWEQGQFKLTIRSELVASPTITLSPANIIGEWSFKNAGQEEKWNTVHASYVEPANGEFKVQDVQWPQVGTTNAYLVADNDFRNTLDLNLPFTNDQLMAQMIAQITLNEARKGISCSVRCTEELLAASVGDRVYVTHPTPGWTLKEFWVTALQLLPDTTVAVNLQEYDATAYSLATMDDRRTYPATDLDSIFSVPPPGAVTITALTPQGIKIAWDAANYGMIDFYEVQARFTSGGEDYITIERVRVTEMREAIAPLARPGQTWDARVRVVNVVGWPSEWTDASQLAIDVPGAVTPPPGLLSWTGYAPTCVPTNSPPELVSVDRSDRGGDSCTDMEEWIHTVSWVTTGANDALYHTEIEVATDSGGTGYALLVSGLTTASSSTEDYTGISGNTAGVLGANTSYRKYKVKIIRNSDSAVIDSLETSQGTITTYTDPCI